MYRDPESKKVSDETGEEEGQQEEEKEEQEDQIGNTMRDFEGDGEEGEESENEENENWTNPTPGADADTYARN